MKYLALALIFVSFESFALKVKDNKVILEKLEDYTFCQSKDYTGGWCDQALKDWVDDNPKDAFEAGKLTRKHMNAWGAIHFFSLAHKEKKVPCNDADVSAAVVSALSLPKASHEKVIEQAREIGIKTCFNEMKDAIAKDANVGSALFLNTCADLNAAGMLGTLKKKKCPSI